MAPMGPAGRGGGLRDRVKKERDVAAVTKGMELGTRESPRCPF